MRHTTHTLRSATVIALTVWLLIPVADTVTPPRTVETWAYNVLTGDGKRLLFFRDIADDSVFIGAALASQRVRTASTLDYTDAELHTIVTRYRAWIAALTDALEEELSETDYFIRTHSVRDEGFDMIARYGEQLSEKKRDLKRIAESIDRITPHTRLRIIRKAERKRVDDIPLQDIFVEGAGGVWRGDFWWRTTTREGRGVGTMTREGKGVGTDGDGRLICGVWENDTLREGRRTDSSGTYTGMFSPQRTAQGHGRFTDSDGAYHEGRYDNDRRDGFGFELRDGRLRAGEWIDDRYRGERLAYTSERIYGIDIARYQHGSGRRYYPIQWNRLRITGLGRRTKLRDNDTIDFPVSFVYIKSTESTSIRNRHYAADYKQARKAGLRCGAYHFFSTKTDAKAQAAFFLKHTFFRPGDFPPVLDVEPSESQIRKMGGEGVLLNAIRTWMRTVTNRTGIKPVLYVNQAFVDRHLVNAPDIKRDYNVWIARYGEYKPDVRLVYWQLCPDGKVTGIHGNVDINVFNGYADAFAAFIDTATVK